MIGNLIVYNMLLYGVGTNIRNIRNITIFLDRKSKMKNIQEYAPFFV
jgi:hypothetical protein